MLAVSEAIASRQGTTHRAVAIQKVSLALAPPQKRLRRFLCPSEPLSVLPPPGFPRQASGRRIRRLARSGEGGGVKRTAVKGEGVSRIRRAKPGLLVPVLRRLPH
ncbi:hypothetical protein AOLI_G00017650 [Acnodon oligacanthus]